MNQDERVFSIDAQKIDLTEIYYDGRILDIGGGEGIIGQIMRENVVAIDPRGDELAESSEGPLKIIMEEIGQIFCIKLRKKPGLKRYPARGRC